MLQGISRSRGAQSRRTHCAAFRNCAANSRTLKRFAICSASTGRSLEGAANRNPGQRARSVAGEEHRAGAARDCGVEPELVIIKTSGDKFQQTSFSQIGTKGVFIKELEDALLDERVDLAVHSMKDVPTEMPDGPDDRRDLQTRGRARRSAFLERSARWRRCLRARASARAACAGSRNCFTREAICACSNCAETWIRESKS